jgi:glycosyltransferase 2 family protein
LSGTLTANPKTAVWRWVHLAGGVLVLALLVWKVGTGPFLDAVRQIDRRSIAGALALGVPITLCGAWRWRLVAARLGIRLPLGHALAACYRAQFLNSTLPTGVVGDVHRAVRHGADLGDIGLGIRAVALERFAGQAATIAMAVIALALLPSPVKAHLPALLTALAMVVAVVALVAWALTRRPTPKIPEFAWQSTSGSVPKTWIARQIPGSWRAGSWGARVRGDVKGLFTGGAWLGVVVTSFVALAGHVATFVLAARTAGSPAPLVLLVPLLLLALLAMVLPLNVAGWGLREGTAAWAFGAAGLTAAEGVTTAVTYGVLVTVASLPGAAVLILRRLNRELGSGDLRDVRE